MSDTLTFSHSGGKSTSTPLASLRTCEPRGTFCQQMVESQNKEDRGICFIQQESNNFSLRTADVNRKHSADGTTGSGSGPTPRRGSVDSDRYHPYHRQFSDGAGPGAGCLQQCTSSFGCLQEACSPDARSHSTRCEASSSSSWDQYNGSVQQSSFPEPPSVPVDPTCFLSQSYPFYSSSIPVQQVFSGQYPNYDQSNSSKYSLQSLCAQSHQESTAQSIFPKPIYSYSILIFLALKNSKTGRLPVSEIYSFMTEHFPYFKSAPDGWKNSVRHNLSLNKCFQKVENKSENLSRKGCLWALNPAKVEKMQDELHKWRRKDPISVRRSMASPDDLDRLLGEKPTKLRSLPPFTNPALLSRVAQLRPPLRRPQYAHVQPPQPCYLPPATAQPSHSFALYSPCGQQPAAGVPSATGSLPMAGKMPPSYNGALQAEYRSRSMQDLLLEGGASYDIDTLNPSLTDLQLQGNLWDSLVFDPRVTTTSALQDHRVQTGCPRVTSPGGQTSDVGRQKAGDEDENTGRSFDQHAYSNGLHPAVYSGVESLAGYLTSCSTSISLI